MALAKGASMAGTATCSGEGGMIPPERDLSTKWYYQCIQSRYGFNPHHLMLADAGGIAARVAVMEPTGMDTFVACRHEGVELSAVFRERHDFEPRITIHLQPDLQRAHLFDAGTGERLVA